MERRAKKKLPLEQRLAEEETESEQEETEEASTGDEAEHEDGEAEAEHKDAEDEAWGRHSMKNSFMTKVLSPLIGYGSTFELVQYVYDLNLWTTLGSKKNLGYDVPLRVLMKGHSFSPLYWKEVHNALVDLVRQVGLPKLFWTISPLEYLAPYHEWVTDEMQKTLRERMHLPAAETLHMTHCLLQITHGLLTGTNQHKDSRLTDRSWSKHLLAAKDDSGHDVELTVFTRLEFQDGSRKEGTFRYQGSGRPHIHVLIFGEDFDRAKLENFVKASLPHDDDALAGKVKCSQRDRAEE